MAGSLNSEVFGVHTVSTGAVVHESPDSISVPLSRSIRTWSADGSHVDHVTPHHRSVITYLTHSPDGSLLASGDWSGVVAVYEGPGWRLKYTFPTDAPPIAAIKFLDTSTVVVLGRGAEEGDPGCLAIYNLRPEGARLRVSIVDRIYQIALTHGGRVLAWRWCEPEFTLLQLCKDELKERGRWEAMMEMSMGWAISPLHTVLSTKSRDLVVLDTATLTERARHSGLSSIPLWTLQFLGPDCPTHLLLQANTSTMSVVDVVSGETVRSFPGPGAFSCFLGLSGSTSGSTSGLSGSTTILWAVTVDGVVRYEQERIVRNFQRHSVSCAGVDLSGNTVVSGDMSGNLLQWTVGKRDPLTLAVVPDSIRCVKFISDSRVVFGTLTGSLYQTCLHSFDTDLVSASSDTITCIERHNLTLCIGVVTGEIEVFSMYDITEPYLSKQFTLLVHAAQPDSDNPRFGSLHIRAEVWSVAFSPDGSLLATASEDQSVRIVELARKERIAEYRDHSMAVTAVSWTEWRGRSLLVSCSDDNTAVIREHGEEGGVVVVRLELPGNVFGASTLTYTGFLEEEGTGHLIVICTSSGGYVIVWRVSSDNGGKAWELVERGVVLFSERVHQGSIEGLKVRGEVFVTCGADNCAQRHQLQMG